MAISHSLNFFRTEYQIKHPAKQTFSPISISWCGRLVSIASIQFYSRLVEGVRKMSSLATGASVLAQDAVDTLRHTNTFFSY